MNFISSAGFVSLYPELTLAKKGLELYTGRPEWINKYRNRGFDIRPSLFDWEDIPIHICGHNSSCLSSQRKITDPYTLFVPFNDNLISGESRMEWVINLDPHTQIGWQFTREPCIQYVEFVYCPFG